MEVPLYALSGLEMYILCTVIWLCMCGSHYIGELYTLQSKSYWSVSLHHSTLLHRRWDILDECKTFFGRAWSCSVTLKFEILHTESYISRIFIELISPSRTPGDDSKLHYEQFDHIRTWRFKWLIKLCIFIWTSHNSWMAFRLVSQSLISRWLVLSCLLLFLSFTL